MTKTLTEQWREGTLEDGFYYIKKNLCGIKDIKTEELFSGEFCTVPNEYIEEVLEPVPSYDEYQQLVSKAEQLEKRLAIATKALKDVSLSLWDEMECRSCAKKALKEMKGVK